MPDATFVQPLSGSEVIEDFLGQIRKRLQGSCNLRSTDAYPRGYSGKFTYTLECYGVDTVIEQGELITGPHKDDPQTTIVHGDSEIPLEPELNAVRERSGQDEPVLATTADGNEIVRKRRYSRRVTASAPLPTGGGAEEFAE